MSLQYTRHTRLTLICHEKIPGEKLSDGQTSWTITKRNYLSTLCTRASKRNFARRNNTTLGTEDRLKLLKIVDLSWQYKKNNNEKIKIKCQWSRSEIHVPFLGSPGRVPMYRFNPSPSHRPCAPFTSPADELKLQSLKIDGCGPSSVIKIVKMKYNRIDIKMWLVSTSFKINIEINFFQLIHHVRDI